MTDTMNQLQNDDMDEWEKKFCSIEVCLQGDDDNNMIDVWQLREYCLTKGGLLDPKLRKRAWPILTQALFFMNNNGNHPTSSSSVQQQQPMGSITNEDLLQIQRDVKRTVWNVKAHFRFQQQQKDDEDEMVIAAASATENLRASDAHSTRRVMFAVANTKSKTNNIDGSSSHSNEDEQIGTAHPNDNNGDDDAAGTTSIFGNDDASQTTHSTFGTTSIHSRSIRRTIYRRASKHEQRTLTNVIVTCLRNPVIAVSSEQLVAGEYHYYTGFHNLTALIMVNVESLSISSILLSKLATYHLRDAFQKDRMVMDTALKVIFFPLLKSIDTDLYDHVAKQGTDGIKKLAVLVVSCISNWFATDVTDIAAASRLLDVFLVSHPTAPLYFAVALFVHYKDTILSSSSSITETVRYLPLFQNDTNYGITTTNASLAAVEQIIALTLKYMEQYKPNALVEMCMATSIWAPDVQQQLRVNVASIAMLSASPPTWCTYARSPNEWMIIQNSINPGLSTTTVDSNMSGSDTNNTENYPLSTVALGRELITKIDTEKYNNGTGRMNSICMSIFAVVITTTLVRYFGSNNTTAVTIPTEIPIEIHPVGISDQISSRLQVSYTETTTTIDPIASSVCGNDCQVELTENITGLMSSSAIVRELQTIEPSSFDEEDSLAPSALYEVKTMLEDEDISTEDAIESELTVELPLERGIDTSIPTLVVSSSGDNIVRNVTMQLTDIELAFDLIVMQLINHRMTKMDRRLQTVQPYFSTVTDRLKPVHDAISSNLNSHVLKAFSGVKKIYALKEAIKILALLSTVDRNIKDWFRMLNVKYLLVGSNLVEEKLRGNEMIQKWNKWKESVLMYLLSKSFQFKVDMVRIESQWQKKLVNVEIQTHQAMDQIFVSVNGITSEIVTSMKGSWRNVIVPSWNQLGECAINC